MPSESIGWKSSRGWRWGSQASLVIALSSCGGTTSQSCPCGAPRSSAAAPPAPPPPASAQMPAPSAPVAASSEPASAPSAVSPPPNDLFPGWFVNGTAVKSYRAVRDRNIKQTGAASARLQSVEHVDKGFGGMMQSFGAEKFRGKRVRFSALVKTENVGGWVGLWMRVDRPNRQTAAFDNMQDRAIKGSTDWQRYSVVLDTAKDAETMNFGILMDGEGTAWIDDAKSEIVSASVPVTNTELAEQARNLDFEE